MGNITGKDELLKLLRSGKIEEFNTGRSYEDSIDLTEIDLKECLLSGVNFSKIDLSGSDLSQCELHNVNFSESNLSAVNFTLAEIENTDFSDANMEGALLTSCCIANCDFTATELNGANLCSTDFTATDLSLCENLMHTTYNKNTIWPSDECLPDDFDPEYDQSFAELEDEDDFSENLSY